MKKREKKTEMRTGTEENGELGNDIVKAYIISD